MRVGVLHARVDHHLAGLGKTVGCLGDPTCVVQLHAFGAQDLDHALRVRPFALQLGLEDLLRNRAAGGPGPYVETDTRSLLITHLDSRIVLEPGLLTGPRHVAEPIQGAGQLEAGDVYLPIITGAFQQADRFAARVSTLTESRCGVEHQAVVGERLALAPDVTERLANGERPAGVRDTAREP